MRTHEHKGRIWTEVGREPYIRRDGTRIEMIVWTTPCCHEGCTERVEARTTTVGWERAKDFGRKHCPAHKHTREQVNERWASAVKARSQPRRGVEDLV